jgi:stage V sporulation protein R
VERVLDAALSLEQYIDLDQPLRRERYPEFVATPKLRVDDEFHSRFAALDVGVGAAPQAHKKRAPVPAHPERDLLWFIATYAPELESWERDIFLAVREESFYFYPVFATQIMNEGWASYWHARLLRESDFIPQEAYVDAIKCHSDVVRPIAAGEKSALAVNPYHLGFTLWEEIVKRAGIDEALRIRREDDDFSFLRNHLTREIATDMGLFSYQKQQNGQVKVVGGEIEALREGLLSDKYNFGAPRVSVVEMRSDGTLILEHDTKLDGRGLDVERAGKVLQYVKSVWRRPVLLKTLDASSQPVELSADPAAAA